MNDDDCQHRAWRSREVLTCKDCGFVKGTDTATTMKAAMIARVLEGGFEYSDGNGLRDVDLRGLIAIADELRHVELKGE